MDFQINYTDLVKQAQFGCKESMDRLILLLQPRISSYIYRLTLNNDVTLDIRQEALLAVVTSLKGLEHPDGFWSWAYRIASNKVQEYFRNQQREKAIQKTLKLDKNYLSQKVPGSYGDGLKSLIEKELSEAIADAMSKLKFRHRNILVLRCCEQMSYSEIADIMNCSKLTAEVLFYRAKHSLKRELSKHDIGKGLLLTSLWLFGQMTTPADAAPATATITAASTKVGPIATALGAAGTKLGIGVIAMITASLLTIGGIAGLNQADNSNTFSREKPPERSAIKSFHYIEQDWGKVGLLNPNLGRGRSLSRGAYEQWFYFPDGIDGPMFMMMQRWDPHLKNRICGWLQSASGNYYYRADENIIYIHNYNLPGPDLKTRRLPSDPPEFVEFIDQVEGKIPYLTYIRDKETGLLVGVLDHRFYNAENFRSSISYNILDEVNFKSFLYPWPPDASVVDKRDTMHKRGWTYFRISGKIGNEQILGWGRVPFIYGESKKHPTWLKIDVGDRIKIIDGPQGAYLKDFNGKLIATYPAGSFFKGLSRPWFGMNTIDIVRRDAVEKRVKFRTEALDYNKEEIQYERAKVTLIEPANRSKYQVVFTINLFRNLLEKIEFSAYGDSGQKERGELEFQYLEEVDNLADEFSEPEKIAGPETTHRESPGILWLVELLDGVFAQ